MKKILLLMLGVFILNSCTSTTDSNTTKTTVVVPLAPTNITGKVISTTKINLSWTDNSTNELGFKIERKTGSSTYSVIGTTNTNELTFNDSNLSPSTTYSYRVYSYNNTGNSLTYSNEITVTTNTLITLPILTTTIPSSITENSSISGGTITSDGGAAITARGIVWNTSPNPTISNSKTVDGIGIGTFTSFLQNLTSSTSFYVRAYATNSIGTSYGNEITFTTIKNNILINIPGPIINDIDGNLYESVKICNQIWTKSNLDVSKYTDGTPIPQVTNPADWVNLTTGAWCYYNNINASGIKDGKLYNWYAVKGIHDVASLSDPNLRKKLAPVGWHIPSDSEWNILASCLGDNAGGKMKSIGTTLWVSPNTNATNESGFSGHPRGLRRGDIGQYEGFGPAGYWWSSTEYSNPKVHAWGRGLNYSNGNIFRDFLPVKTGLSIRFIKD